MHKIRVQKYVSFTYGRDRFNNHDRIVDTFSKGYIGLVENFLRTNL